MEMLVIADEIIRDVRHAMGGIEINEQTLAREAIHRATPGGGFLADDHTLDNWKWAQWRPMLIDRTRYDNWLAKGSKDMAARANERARSILKEHGPAPLPEAAEEAIQAVLEHRAS
jgi:trimethylamine--corrinoid protein Co-methyltransferase